MGTYTANYNLFMPSLGEQGWGTLVNGNFSTIDTTMKSLSNSIGTLETETDAFDERITALEENSVSFDSNGDVVGNITGSATSLNIVVNVSASSTKYTFSDGNGRWSQLTICSYVPGVLYTGYVKVKNLYGNSNEFVLYVLSSSDTWSSIDMTSTSEKNYSFTNAKCVFVRAYLSNYNSYIYLPIYS